MGEEIKSTVAEKMDKAIEAFRRDLGTVRTGRASLALLDGLMVEYYGTPTPVNQVASLTVPDARTIGIQPWETALIPAIEKAILKSDLGINPSNDGKLIRLSVPMLSEERRKEMVKLAHKKAEEAKIAIRNIRRDGNDTLKKKEKDKEIREDELKRFLDDVQQLTDEHVKKVDEILVVKEQEILEV